MKYILDTNVLIYFLKGHLQVTEHVLNTSIDLLNTTTINEAELIYGVYNSTQKKQNLIQVELLLKKLKILPFCSQAAHIFGENKALLKKSGTLIDDADLMIASIALNQRMILVTNNVRHFMRLKHLKIENWTLP